MAFRLSLFGEVVSMAFDTVRTNKMRSALTVLGVVIGITSIVGMTAMVRGFDESLRDMIRAARPQHHHRTALRHHQLCQRCRDPGSAEAAEPDDLRRARARAAGVHHPAGRRRAGRGRRAADPGARLLRSTEDQADHRLRHQREFRRGHAHPVPVRPVLQRHRSAVPQERVRARQHRVQIAVRAERHRSHRQDRARRQRALPGRGRVRQAAHRRRLQPERRRLRGHPVHGVSAHLRPAGVPRRPDGNDRQHSDLTRAARRHHARTRRSTMCAG